MSDKKVDSARLKVLRDGATEPPFSGAFLNNKKTGMYVCGYCGNELFSSEHKFDSGSGWPSFSSAERDKVELMEDNSFGMQRTELKCAQCKSHLGHIFDYRPKDKKIEGYYCVNSLSLDFKEKPNETPNL